MFEYHLFNNIIDWIWQTSLKASLLIIFILILQWILKKYLTPKWIHGLWILLIVRLLLPGNFESQFSLYNLFNKTQRPIIVENPIILPQYPPIEMNQDNYQITEDEIVASSFSWREGLKVIWLTGILSFLIYSLLINLKFVNKLKNKYEVQDKTLLQCFQDCKSIMKIEQDIGLYQIDGISSPMLYGLFKPFILIPKICINDLSRNEWKHILCHELAHLRRHDIIWAHLAAFFQILHWFNPMVWFAFYKMRQDREIACDALVLKYLNQEGKAYGNTLIRLLELFSVEQFRPITVGIIENKNDIKQRLKNIIKPRKQTLIWTIVAILMMGVLGCALLTEARKKETSKYTVILEESRNGCIVHASSFQGKDEFQNKNFEADTIWISNYQLRSDTTKFLKIFGINLKGISIDSLHWKITADLVKIDTLDHYDDEPLRISRKRQLRRLNGQKINYLEDSENKLERIFSINNFPVIENGVETYYVDRLKLFDHQLKDDTLKRVNFTGFNFKVSRDNGTHWKIVGDDVQIDTLQTYFESYINSEESQEQTYKNIVNKYTESLHNDKKNLSAPGFSNPKSLGYSQSYPDSLIIDEVDIGQQILQKVKIPQSTVLNLTKEARGNLPEYGEGIRIIPNNSRVKLKEYQRLKVFKKDQKYGFKNQKDEIVFNPVFEQVSPFSWVFTENHKGLRDEYIASFKLFGHWGFIDSKGNVIIPPKYVSVRDFQNGLALVQSVDWHFINKKGSNVFKQLFEDAESFRESRAFVKKNGKWGVIDTKGRIIVEPKYEQLSQFHEGLAAVKLNGKYGYINRMGQTTIPPQYEESFLFQENLAKTKYKGKYGFISKSAKWIIPPKYDEVGDFYEGLASVRIGNKYGFLDKKGNIVIQPKFDCITLPFINGKARVVQFEQSDKQVPGKSMIIDTKGNVIQENLSVKSINDNNVHAIDMVVEFTPSITCTLKVKSDKISSTMHLSGSEPLTGAKFSELCRRYIGDKFGILNILNESKYRDNLGWPRISVSTDDPYELKYLSILLKELIERSKQNTEIDFVSESKPNNEKSKILNSSNLLNDLKVDKTILSITSESTEKVKISGSVYGPPFSDNELKFNDVEVPYELEIKKGDFMGIISIKNFNENITVSIKEYYQGGLVLKAENIGKRLLIRRKDYCAATEKLN